MCCSTTLLIDWRVLSDGLKSTNIHSTLKHHSWLILFPFRNVLWIMCCWRWCAHFERQLLTDQNRNVHASFIVVLNKYKKIHTHTRSHSHAPRAHRCVSGKHAGCHNKEENIRWYSLFHVTERLVLQHHQAIHHRRCVSHLHTHTQTLVYRIYINVTLRAVRRWKLDAGTTATMAVTVAAMKTSKVSKKSENTTTPWKLCGLYTGSSSEQQ